MRRSLLRDGGAGAPRAPGRCDRGAPAGWSGALAGLNCHELVGQARACLASIGRLTGHRVGVERCRDADRGLLGQLARVGKADRQRLRLAWRQVADELQLLRNRPAAGGCEGTAGACPIVQVGRVEQVRAVVDDVELAVRAQVVEGRQRGGVRKDQPDVLRVRAGVLVDHTLGLQLARKQVAERQVGAGGGVDADRPDRTGDVAVSRAGEVRPARRHAEGEGDTTRREGGYCSQLAPATTRREQIADSHLMNRTYANPKIRWEVSRFGHPENYTQ